jgi:zinc transport system substrate-binding protein
MRQMAAVVVLLGLLGALSGCEPRAGGRPAPGVAASNAYLAATARDLLGADARVLTLAEPGTCPGHFDLRPSQMRQLSTSRVLLRFDFQAGLDRNLQAATQRGLRIAEIAVNGALCEPDTYFDACGQAADALVAQGLMARDAARHRLAEIRVRLDALASAARAEVREVGLFARPVVTSRHQVGFCRFLGLDVVADFSGVDTSGVGEVNAALRQGEHAALVVANLPEGTGLARSLGEHLGAPVVVFGNFPDATRHGGRFDDLVRENVRRLVAAAP